MNFKCLMVLLTCLSIPTVRGDSFAEVGDAGQLPGTAQSTVGNPLNTITGAIGTLGDVDMFAIFIDGSVPFFATTVGSALLDPQLFLFDSSGMGVIGTDDPFDLTTLQATLTDTALPAGIYYLAINSFNDQPTSVSGLIFPGSNGVVGPTGPGGGDPITGWSGGGLYSGTYSITLRGVQGGSTTSPIPEPMSMLLLGSALTGICIAGRRKARQAQQ